MVAATVVALPLLALIAFSAINRYTDDRARAETSAANRAVLYATLLGEEGESVPPSPARLRELLELSPLPEDSVITISEGDRVIAQTNGSDGVERVWGMAPIAGTDLTVGFGLPGDAAYGAARSALVRDFILAGVGALLVLATALFTGGRLSAPIRRLAATAGSRRRGSEVEAIEGELTRRADRQTQLNAQLQAILDAAMDVVVVVDSDRRFVSVNDAACRFYERPREELIGKRLDDLIGQERAERDWEDFLSEERVAKGMLEDVWEGDQEGSPRMLEVRSHPEFLPGRHLFVMRDVTERRMLEDQLRQAQKMEAVGQLAGGVAHDFNNLLTVIGGYGEIARRRIGAGPGAAELLEVERAAERATQLTKQLLAFSRQQVLDPVPLDLAEIAGGLLPMLRRLIGEDIEIAMLTDKALPAVVADRAQLEQVLVNLAVNARDAMPTGGTLTIETRGLTLDDNYSERHAGVEPGEYVCLTVTDTGVGMTQETMEHVFEPFFTTKEVGQGTGLGLATVHGIVNQSGGHILVYSEPDLGTSFKVYLPATGAAAATEGDDEGNGLDRLGGTETILLCEDEDGVRQLIDHVLTTHGYRVLSTGGPHEAVERAVEHGETIDALVSDVIMPDMSGPELARRLESVRPGLRTLFVSGYTAETVRDRGRLPEGSAFLEKPFDQLSLLRALRALLGQPARRPG